MLKPPAWVRRLRRRQPTRRPLNLSGLVDWCEVYAQNAEGRGETESAIRFRWIAGTLADWAMGDTP